MNNLYALEQKSLFLIREVSAHEPDLAVLWSMGKDSTTLLWLCRKAFFGRIPFPVLHIDTTFKFPEMYTFREKLTQEWGFDLRIAKNQEALDRGINYETCDAIECCHQLKTVALQQTIEQEGFKGLLVGIRGDEHGVRAKERFVSPRDADFHWDYAHQLPELWGYTTSQVQQGNHMRIHPLLEWTELDIWRYTQQEGIPVNPLYFSQNHQRYRSLGCQPITKPIKSEADTIQKIIEELEQSQTSERAGRAQDKEALDAMQKLRSLGYM